MFSWLKKRKKAAIIEEKKQQTIPNFNDEEAKVILTQIKKEFGLDYTRQEYITLRKIERFAIKNEIFDFSQLHKIINSSETMKEKLINMLSVGETYFYRELGHFKILIQLMKEKNIKNILCAPSSSGEEVFSILLFMQEYLADISKVHITGIDINSEAISLAQEACYSKRSISNLPMQLVRNNFIKKDKYYCCQSTLKNHATFLRHNIFDATVLKGLGKFEVIFCRNMLIYFDDKQKKEALANLRELLEENGILFLGHADISFEPDGFIKQASSEGSYFQKSQL